MYDDSIFACHKYEYTLGSRTGGAAYYVGSKSFLIKKYLDYVMFTIFT